MCPEAHRDIDDLLDLGDRPSLTDFARRDSLRRICLGTGERHPPDGAIDDDDASGRLAAAKKELADLESRLDFF